MLRSNLFDYEGSLLLMTRVALFCKQRGYEWAMFVDVDEYVDKFNPDMMELLFEWANGAKFVEVMKVTDAFEGTVIRVIRRLDELLRQLASAAFAIGAFELKGKFEDASAAIKRDIVFAASLYL